LASDLTRSIYSIVLILFTFSLLAGSINTAAMPQSSNDNTLDKYVGMELKIYVLGRIREGNDKYPGIISPNEYTERVKEILYFISSDPEKVFSNLKLYGYTQYLNETIRIYKGVYSGHNILVALGDLGSFLVKIDNGETGTYCSCNLTNITLKSKHIILHRDLIVKYHGQYAEQTVMARPGMICNVVNGTTTCSTPSTAIVQQYLYNPYEVYYLYIDGFRIEPPIRIRCSIPEYSDGLLAVYVEGFIPHKITKKVSVKLTYELVQDIINKLRDEGLDIKDPREVYVEDMYLTLAPSHKMIPVLKLRYSNTVAWIGIDSNGVTLLSFAVFSGMGGAGNGDQGLRIDWDNILSKATITNTNTRRNDIASGYIDNVLIILLLTAFIAVVTLVLYMKRSRAGHV